MEAVTISKKFQITIPRKIRERFNLKPGDKVAFITFENSLRLVVVPSIEQARGMLKGMNAENIREEVDEER